MERGSAKDTCRLLVRSERMKTFSNVLHERIVKLCRDGDALIESKDSIGALQEYHQAWDLLPEPKEDWDAATWILGAIGDAHFGLGDYKNAIAAFSNALDCPEGFGNPFIHLRLGESYFELGDAKRAGDELTRAYMGSGRDIFAKEEPKYFEFLQTLLLPPPGKSELE
jgi:tetratricopeptide (TPR) repeat protein